MGGKLWPEEPLIDGFHRGHDVRQHLTCQMHWAGQVMHRYKTRLHRNPGTQTPLLSTSSAPCIFLEGIGYRDVIDTASLF